SRCRLVLRSPLLPYTTLFRSRFVIRDDGEVIDLATGHGVVLTIAAAGGGADQARWAVRCHALHTLCHPAIAPLLDYGALGESQRSEEHTSELQSRFDLVCRLL